MLDATQLRQAFGKFITGVTVVTTSKADGTPIGITANSFTSVSLDPPLLLICLSRSLGSYAIFAETDHFAVNILSQNQQDVATLFAQKGADRFTAVAWQADELQNPIIADAVAYFSCTTEDKIISGDHLILIGRVNSFFYNAQMALGYYNGQYFNLDLERHLASKTGNPAKPPKEYRAGAIIRHADSIWVTKNSDGWHDLPSIRQPNDTLLFENLIAHCQKNELHCHLDTIYSIFSSADNSVHYTYYSASTKKASPAAAGSSGYWVPLVAVDKLSFATEAVASMLRRFVSEANTDISGLYIGDEKTGQVYPQNK